MSSIAMRLFWYLVLISAFNGKLANAQNIGDTLLSVGHKGEQVYRRVYIASGNSEYHHSMLTPFSIETKKNVYLLNDLPNPDNEPVHTNKLTDGEWVSVYLNKGKLFAYSPSEPYVNTYLTVRGDTIVFNDFNDGMVAERITAMLPTSNLETIRYIIKCKESEAEAMNFTFINRQKSIAIISFSRFGNIPVLVAKKEYFLSLPIVVNHCPNQRCPEWDF